MVKYKLSLKLKDLPDSFDYYRDLTQAEENYPEKFLTSTLREEIREHFQQQSCCHLNDGNLNRLINHWIQDIKEGYRESVIALDLPPIGAANLHQLQDSGNQEIPPLVFPDISEIEPSRGALPPLIFC